MSNQISSRHKQVARLLVGGHSQTEIARLLNVHKSTISRILRQTGVSQEVSRLNEMADINSTACVPGIPERIREGAQKGIEVLEEILADERTEPEVMKLKANVALEVLSRAGYAPVKQIQIQQASVSTHLTMEEIEEIKRRAKERFESKKK